MFPLKKKIAFLLPSLIGFIAFWVYPFLKNFIYIFQSESIIEDIEYVLNNPYFHIACKNTFLFSLAAVPSSILFAFLLAILAAKFAKKLPFVRKACFLPVVLPSAIIIVLWNIFFQNAAPFSSLLLIYLWKYCGLYFIILLTALLSIDQNMLDAAYIDGASRFQTVIYFIIPWMIPTLFFTLILSFVNSLKIFRESYLLYGEYPDTQVYMYQNFINNHFYKLNYSYVAIAGVLLAGIIFILTGVLLILEKRWSEKIW